MLNKVINFAKEAGQFIRENFRNSFEVEFKSNQTDLVTEIDKKSEKIIIDFIRKEYPSHGILAEESGGDSIKSEYLWVIDPIDGTSNFAHGLPIFSVSIGVQKLGETICGCVYDVMRDAVYYAERGGGAHCNERKLYVSKGDSVSKSLLVTGFPYNIAVNPDNAIEHFGTFLKSARGVRRLGSAAIDLAYVADGVFDGFWEVSLKPWDMCAGNLLVEEAGGMVTDFSGTRKSIFTASILATNGIIHEEMMKIINSIKPE